jgi:hypothetical protein
MARLLLVGSLAITTLCDCRAAKENNDRYVVLAMAYGLSSVGEHWSATLQIPALVVYDDGLVIRLCEDKGWPEICQTHVSTRRIRELVTRIATTEGFGHNCEVRHYPRMGLGPTVNITMLLNTPEHCGGLHWFWRQPDPSSFPILEGFIDEIDSTDDRQLYQPEQVSIVVSHESCTGKAVLPLFCASDGVPLWPFDFSPTSAISECNLLEHPMPIAEVREILGDEALSEIDYGSHLPISADAYGFHTETGRLFLIYLRPYLPGESVRESCRTSGSWTQYDTLPWEFPWE